MRFSLQHEEAEAGVSLAAPRNSLAAREVCKWAKLELAAGLVPIVNETPVDA